MSATEVHRFDGSGKFPNVPMALTADGYLFGGHDGWKEKPGRGGLWNLLDGTLVPNSAGPWSIRDGGVVIAGTSAFNMRNVENKTGDSWTEASFPGWSLPKTGVATELSGRRELGFDDLPSDSDLDTWLPTFGEVHRCLPYCFGLRNGGVVPSGNRIFVQSWAHMYSLGDPKVPYDWNLASRPKALAETLAAAAAGPLDGLGSSLVSDRERAREAFIGMPADQRLAALPVILAAVDTHAWPGFDAGLELIQTVGLPAGPVAGPRLLAALRKAFDERLADHVRRLVAVVSAVAPDRCPALVSELGGRFATGDTATLATAAAAAGGLGPASASLTADLVRLVGHDNPSVAVAAARALAGLGVAAWGPASDKALAALTARLDASKPAVAQAALQALATAKVGAAPALDRIEALLATRELTQAAATTLGAIGAKAKPAIPALSNACRHPDRGAVQACAAAVLAIEPTQAGTLTEVLGTLIADEPAIATNAVQTLASLARRRERNLRSAAVDALMGDFKKHPAAIQGRIILALAEFGTDAEPAVPLLRDAANTPSTAGPAKAALARIAPNESTTVDTDIEAGE